MKIGGTFKKWGAECVSFSPDPRLSESWLRLRSESLRASHRPLRGCGKAFPSSPVAAAAGPYEVKGTTLYQYDLVGKNQSPGAIELNKSGKTAQFAATAELRFDGNNTMVQIQKSADGKYEIRRTFTRLESAAEVEARPPAAPSIAGVWTSTSYVATGANPVANPKRLPNIVIYTKEHFSSVTQDSDTRPTLPPRPVLAPPKDANKLTDVEKLARYDHWALIGAAAGRYQVKGTTFYQYPLVSKNHTAAIISRNQTGELGTIAPNSEIKFEGTDTMVQIATSPDGKTVTRRTYKRLE